ncbi:MAG: hypothetical protein R2761_03180 [Acidimicrobiales bacterium]
MTVDFETLRAAGTSALEAGMLAESEGMSRLEVFKAILHHWSVEPFAVECMERYGSGYPSRAAQAAATIGLAAVVLAYPTASAEEVTAFERTTALSRKVDALARADRADDALRFYDRLDPEVLRLTSLTQAEARHAVWLQRGRRSQQRSVIIDPMEQHTWGWVFPALDPTDRLAGPSAAPPLLVDRFTGAVVELTADEPLEAQIGRYEETGWPHSR